MSLWVFVVFVLALYCLRGRVFSYKLGLAADATMIILSLPQALLTPPIPPVLPKTLFCRNDFDVVPVFSFVVRVYLKLLSLCTPFQSTKFRNSCRYTCTARCWRLLSSVGTCLVQEVADPFQVPGTISSRCRKFIGSITKSLHWHRTSRANEEHCSPLCAWALFFGSVTSLLPTLRHQMEVSD